MGSHLRGVELSDVSARAGGQRILHDLTLGLPGRAMVALTGPSGSGKTTLLGVIGGAHAHSGTVAHRYGGDFSSADPLAVSWIFQAPRAVAAHRAWEVVATPLLLTGAAGPVCSDRARAALAELGLGSLADRRFGRLSGGERQRTLIARALVEAKPILLADEPSAALDRANAHVVGEALARAAATRLVVVASHDAVLWEYCDDLHRLDAGRLA